MSGKKRPTIHRLAQLEQRDRRRARAISLLHARQIISVRKNRDGSVSMSSRGVNAPDLRKVLPALLGIVDRPAPSGDSIESKHCDDYIDDVDAPACLRTFLAFSRQPAHGMLSGSPPPRLFADLGGSRVRVVMASRMGDVGVTSKLNDEIGYEDRVMLDALANFGVDP